MKLNGDTIKDFFVNHVEKIGFAVALALVGLFVYNGIKLKGYERTPIQLRNSAEQATTQIASYDWNEKLEEEDLDPKRDFSKEVKETTLDVNASGYPTRVPWVPVPSLPMVKRSDPELFAPVNLEVDVAFGPLPVVGVADPIAALEAAPKPEPKVIRKRVKRKKSSRGDDGGEGMGGMMGMSGSGAGDMEDEGSGDSGMGMGMGMDGESGAGGGGSFAAGSGGRKFPNPPKYWNQASGGGGGMMTMAPTTSKVGVVGRMVVAVKGLVRYQDQFDEFEKTLQDAKYYRPQYDRPDFLSFIVERAEIGDDPNAPLDWKSLSNLPKAFTELQKYPGRGRELIDPNHTMPNVLTMEAPPILLRDVDRFGTHPDIPLKHEKPVSTTPDKPETPESTVPSDDPLLCTRPGGGAMAGAGDMSSGGGMEGMGMDMDGSGDSDMGMESGGAGGMESGAVTNKYPMTKYKMIRFFDTTALPGKKYQYRFQVIISDPNHPKDEDLNIRILEPDVLKRLADVKKQEDATKRRIFYRFSPWSEPSPVIQTPRVERVLAGPGTVIANSKTYKTPTGGVVHFVPPTARVSSVMWGGRALPTDVSYTTDATFGTVMNTKSDLKIIHPATQELKLAKDFSFRSNNVVVDMTVAEALTAERENPQVAPTTIAVSDANGNIIVRDEVDDLEQYRIYAFVDDEPPPVIEGGGAAAGDDEGEGMEGMGFDFGGGGDDDG